MVYPHSPKTGSLLDPWLLKFGILKALWLVSFTPSFEFIWRINENMDKCEHSNEINDRFRFWKFKNWKAREKISNTWTKMEALRLSNVLISFPFESIDSEMPIVNFKISTLACIALPRYLNRSFGAFAHGMGFTIGPGAVIEFVNNC